MTSAPKWRKPPTKQQTDDQATANVVSKVIKRELSAQLADQQREREALAEAIGEAIGVERHTTMENVASIKVDLSAHVDAIAGGVAELLRKDATDALKLADHMLKCAEYALEGAPQYDPGGSGLPNPLCVGSMAVVRMAE